MDRLRLSGGSDFVSMPATRTCHRWSDGLREAYVGKRQIMQEVQRCE